MWEYWFVFWKIFNYNGEVFYWTDVDFYFLWTVDFSKCCSVTVIPLITFLTIRSHLTLFEKFINLFTVKLSWFENCFLSFNNWVFNNHGWVKWICVTLNLSSWNNKFYEFKKKIWVNFLSEIIHIKRLWCQINPIMTEFGNNFQCFSRLFVWSFLIEYFLNDNEGKCQ